MQRMFQHAGVTAWTEIVSTCLASNQRESKRFQINVCSSIIVSLIMFLPMNFNT